jgi:hypothetical protein
MKNFSEVEKFIQANTQELAKDKWLCPLSGKKFKGPEFVRKHIFNKHSEKVEEVKKEVGVLMMCSRDSCIENVEVVFVKRSCENCVRIIKRVEDQFQENFVCRMQCLTLILLEIHSYLSKTHKYRNIT